jgi:hypothetical protein
MVRTTLSEVEVAAVAATALFPNQPPVVYRLYGLTADEIKLVEETRA